MRRNSPRVKVHRRETPGQLLGRDLVGDQETGDHEEHIDADKAAMEPRQPGVKSDHREDRDCANAIDIGKAPPRREFPAGFRGARLRPACRYRFGGGCHGVTGATLSADRGVAKSAIAAEICGHGSGHAP